MNARRPGLVADQLYKEYPTPSEPLVVLRGISFGLDPGEALAVTGPSGSGKSTLLYLLGTLERPTRGAVRLAGEDPFTLEGERLAAFRNRRIGFIFQEHHLLPQCSALENVLIPTLANGASPGAEEEAKRLLDRVGLGARTDHRPGELSGGERQRVAIARSLINQPALLLADEPTGNLDRRSADAVAELLIELQRERSAVLVLVTHSLELAGRFKRRVELIDGILEPQ